MGVPDEREGVTFIRKEPVKETFSESHLPKEGTQHLEGGKEEKEASLFQKGGLLSLLCLSIGGYLLTFGVLILLFGKNGRLILEL